MRIMLLHVDDFMFKPTKPAIKKPELRDPPNEINESLDNTVVVFVSVEDVDDDSIVEQAISEIIKYARTTNADNIVVYPYAHLSSNLAKPSKALKILHSLKEKLSSKWERTYYAPFGWYKEFRLHCKGHPLSELSKSFSPTERRTVVPARLPPWEWEGLEKKYRQTFKRWGYGENGTVSKLIAESALDLLNKILIENAETGIYEQDIVDEIYTDLKTPLSILTKLLDKLGIEYAQENKYVLHEGRTIAECVDGICETLSLYELTAVKIWSELRKAQRGATPILPPTIAPVHIYIAAMPSVTGYLSKIIDYNLRGYRVTIDTRKQSVGKKLRDAGQLWSLLTAVIGEKEAGADIVTIRIRETGEQVAVDVETWYHIIRDKVRETFGTSFIKWVK